MGRSCICLASVVLLVLEVHGAAAQPTNPGFETGDFSAWLVAGTTATMVVDAGFGAGPTEGTFQALLTSGDGSVGVSSLESFLGLSAGSVSALGNGIATEGSAIRQTFNATAGETWAFDWNFLTNEGTHAFFNDFAFVVFNGVLKELADTNFPTFVLSPTVFGEETGFHSSCFTTTGGRTLSESVSST
jgi:hypothetical protein